MHKNIEMYLKGDDTVDFAERAMFVSFLRSRPSWTLEHCEKLVWTDGIAGTIDAIFIDGDGRRIIVDWKRTKSMYEESLATYQLQLNLYKTILERNGVTCAALMLVMLHPLNRSFCCVDVPVLDVSMYMENAIYL